MKESTELKIEGLPKKGKRKHRLSVFIGLWIIKRVERLLMRYSEIDDQPFLNAADFAWVKTLEENWEKIRVELEQVLKQPEDIPNFQDISKDQSNLTKDDRWKSFFLYGYGYKFDPNCNLCPETTRVIETIPDMFTAFFSVLAPGKHIPGHRGPYKGLLRGHLALIIPEPNQDCWIQVGNETAHWEEGKCLVFDDTYRHQVENNTDGTRVVLFLDVLRPLKFPGSLVNKLVLQAIRLSPFIQDARRNQQAWERRLGC
ncbi:MAG: aspartyl/asparaginyl beta-hydroxylase (cupin superfamily) [Planctomycetota bacterium]|jgi:aspartyl/asparaginyl beta-hydroxylase (cupin superfamily)